MELVALNPKTNNRRNLPSKEFKFADGPSNYRIQAFSDLHYGHDGCMAKEFIQAVGRHAKRKNHFGIFLGDLGEAVVHTDQKRFAIDQGDRGLLIKGPLGRYEISPEKAAAMPFQYYLVEQDVVTPFKDYWTLLMPGNHDLKAFPGRVNPVMPICVRNGIPFGDYQTKLHLADDLKFFMAHGFQSFPVKGTNQASLMARRDTNLYQKFAPLATDCDVMLTGHHHMGHIIEPGRLAANFGYDDGKQLKTRRGGPPAAKFPDGGRYVHPDSRWYASVPCWRTGTSLCRTDYAEVGGYPPADIGYVEIDIKDDRVRTIKIIRPGDDD